jgi:hypothetical protein
VLASQDAGRRQADIEIARAAMPSGILQLEAFALAYPDHRGFKTLRNEVFCQYVAGFAFDDWEDAHLAGRTEATQLAERVVQLAAACADANLALLPAAWRTARGTDAWPPLVAKATSKEVPQLLWIATMDALLLAIEPMKQLGNLDAIAAALARSAALRPGYRDSDAEILLGSIEAGSAPFFGGPDGKMRFAAAREQLGEGALVVDVMFARGVAVAAKDRALFETTLRNVLDADVTRWPERRLSNELSRRKAARYLAAIDRLIPGPAK